MKFKVTVTTLIVAALIVLTLKGQSNTGQRMTPSEIAAVASIGAVAGTSGVTELRLGF